MIYRWKKADHNPDNLDTLNEEQCMLRIVTTNPQN